MDDALAVMPPPQAYLLYTLEQHQIVGPESFRY